MQTAIAMLPSPRTGNPGSRPNQKGGKILAEEISKLIPTPTQVDYKSRGPNSVQVGIDNLFKGENAGANHGLKLQPAFVEWMMGYPDKWTELID